jgi:hypothetical protein
VTAPPAFASIQEYTARLGDIDFWWPYVAEILERHELGGRRELVRHGRKLGTYPTFICGEVVVKLFGYLGSWRETHTAERAAHGVVARDPEIAAPRLLADGRLYDDWLYLITTRMPGDAAKNAELSPEQRLSVAAELGRWVKRVHLLNATGIVTDEDRPALNLTAAAEQSSLPPHLIAQINGYVARLEPFHRVFVHGDLTADHVFVEDGRLVGIIDWGDALVTDRHYEICQVHRDLFNCNKALLRVFLDASNWPVARNFPNQALGLALYRQARGIAQHLTMDVFEPIAALFPLQDIATLDELAIAVFAV